MHKELDLAILQFMKSCTSGLEEMLVLLSEEYRLKFGRPLPQNLPEGLNPIELKWALERSLVEGDPEVLKFYPR